MTKAQDSGDLQNTQVRNLVAAVAKRLERAAAAPAGRAALTLVPGAGRPRFGFRHDQMKSRRFRLDLQLGSP